MSLLGNGETSIRVRGGESVTLMGSVRKRWRRASEWLETEWLTKAVHVKQGELAKSGVLVRSQSLHSSDEEP